jgi:hypothetical protein
VVKGPVATRSEEIGESLRTLASAVHEQQTATDGVMTATLEKAGATAERGWDGVARGYEIAAEHLEGAVGEQRDVVDHLDGARGIVLQIHEETSLVDVSGHLAVASAELHRARAAVDVVLRSLEDAHPPVAATGEERLTELLENLTEDVRAAAAAMTDIRVDVDAERAAAEDAAQGSGRGAAGSGGERSVTAVDARIAELRRHGHAPQRHGAQVTDQQLADRAVWGIDPMTGTTTDGVTGGQHKYGRNATKFTSDEALVTAERFARSTDSFKAQEAQNESVDAAVIKIQEPLVDAFGPGYRDHVAGLTRAGTKAKPTGEPPGSRPPRATDFTDGSLIAASSRAGRATIDY